MEQALLAYQHNRRAQWQLQCETTRANMLRVHNSAIILAKENWLQTEYTEDSTEARQKYTDAVMAFAEWRDGFEKLLLHDLQLRLTDLEIVERRALSVRPCENPPCVSSDESSRSRSKHGEDMDSTVRVRTYSIPTVKLPSFSNTRI